MTVSRPALDRCERDVAMPFATWERLNAEDDPKGRSMSPVMQRCDV